MTAKVVVRGKIIAIVFPQGPRKTSNKQSNLTGKGARKQKINKATNQHREEIIKIRVERSELELKNNSKTEQ